jgi:hypothetical protein
MSRSRRAGSLLTLGSSPDPAATNLEEHLGSAEGISNQVSRMAYLARLKEWGNMVAGSAFDGAAAEQVAASILPPGPPERIFEPSTQDASAKTVGSANGDKISDRDRKGGFPDLLIGMLAAAIQSRAHDPSSLDVIEGFETTEKASLLLLSVIGNLRFRSLLIDNNEWMEDERAGIGFLRDLATLAAQALDRNPRNKGRGRPKTIIPATTWPSALDLCALMVGLRWRALHSQWPGRDNPAAQRWCEQMWKAAGGAPHGGVAACDGALTAWRSHLKSAKQYEPPHPVGSRIKDILAAAAKQRSKPRSTSRRSCARCWASRTGSCRPGRRFGSGLTAASLSRSPGGRLAGGTPTRRNEAADRGTCSPRGVG